MTDDSSSAASLVQYIEDGETVLAEERVYEIPHQSDWAYIDGEAYRVYDVVHTVFPNAGRMVSMVFVWSPDPEATSTDLMDRRDRAVAARAGEGSFDDPTFGISGQKTEINCGETAYATVVISSFPSDRLNYAEGVRISSVNESFIVSDVSHSVEEDGIESEISLFNVKEAENGAEMAGVLRTLKSQKVEKQIDE